jgi:lysophospholipase L1-like esterase
MAWNKKAAGSRSLGARLLRPGLAAAALIAAEGLARRNQGYLLLAWPLQRSCFCEQDRLKIYNRRFYEKYREGFRGWPIQPDLFESDKPEPKYLFKPGQRVALRSRFIHSLMERRRTGILGDGIRVADDAGIGGDRLAPALPGERPFWTSNSWGFRGAEFRLKKPRGAVRIVCLGASTTEGVGRDTATYPFYLGIELRKRFPGRVVEVINAGHHAQAMNDHLEMFRRRVRPLRPDVLVVYSVSGDIRAKEFTGPMPCEPGFPGDCWLKSLPGPIRYAYRRSAIFVVMAGMMGLRSWQPPPLPHVFDDVSPKPGADLYEGRLRQIVQEARLAGAVVVLCSFATAVSKGMGCTPDSPVLCQRLHKSWYPLTPEEVGRAYRYYNARMRAVASELGAPFIDAEAEFPASPRYFSVDASHLNSAGNRILAGIIARHLAADVLPRILKSSNKP